MEKKEKNKQEKSKFLVGLELDFIEVWQLSFEGLRRNHPFTYHKTERKCIYPRCDQRFDKKKDAERHVKGHLKDQFSIVFGVLHLILTLFIRSCNI